MNVFVELKKSFLDLQMSFLLHLWLLHIIFSHFVIGVIDSSYMQLLPLVGITMCFCQGSFQNALSINHNQSLGPKLSHPHLLIVLHCYGFLCCLSNGFILCICLNMLLCWRSLNERMHTVGLGVQSRIITERCVSWHTISVLQGQCFYFLTPVFRFSCQFPYISVLIVTSALVMRWTYVPPQWCITP